MNKSIRATAIGLAMAASLSVSTSAQEGEITVANGPYPTGAEVPFEIKPPPLEAGEDMIGCSTGDGEVRTTVYLSKEKDLRIWAQAYAKLGLPPAWMDLEIQHNGRQCSYSGRVTNPEGGHTDVVGTCSLQDAPPGLHEFIAVTRNRGGTTEWVKLCVTSR